MALEAGIHLLHKPRGQTSFAALNTFLAAAGTERRPRAMHGGTLDPFADGLLLALVGEAVHLFEPLHALPKFYEAELRWGIETDNGDPTGREVGAASAAHLTAQGISEAAAALRGWHLQVPPATSAKKVGGEPAYRKAHRGEAVELPASRVYLHAAEWLSHELPHRSVLRLTCRGGFYVRSFVRDLGRALGTVAHVAALRRTAIGPWRDPASSGPPAVITGAGALPDAPMRILSDAEVGLLRRGGGVPAGQLLAPGWAGPAGFPRRDPPLVAGVHLGRLRFLLRADGGALSPLRELRGGL